MNNIVIDIETIPTQDKAMQDLLIKGIKAPSNWKDSDKIKAYTEEKAQEVLDKAGLYGISNHVICIGVAINDEQPVVFSEADIANEGLMIDKAFKYIADCCNNFHALQFIGHNAASFDIKILRQRAMVLGIKPPTLFTRAFNDKWGEVIYDTMLRWTGDRRDYVSLEKLCVAFNVDSPKNGIKGSEVYQYWKDGKINEIAKYCEGDVIATRDVYKKMTLNKGE